MKSAVVTGASTGIGWGTTKVLVEKGFRVFASVRKQDDADTLTKEFGAACLPLLFDVTDEAAVKAGAEIVADALEGTTLSGLVNNAGIAVEGSIAHIPIERFRRQLEINLVGQVIATQAFLPLLGMDQSRNGKPGRIVNISSVAGKRGAPFLGAYSASKHGLEGMTDSLRRELNLYGIDTIIVAPGEVATPIWDKSEATDIPDFESDDFAPASRRVKQYMLDNGPKGYSVEQLGAIIHTALTHPKPKWRYAPVPNRLINWTIPNLLPRRVLDSIICKNLGLVPEALGKDTDTD